MAEAMEVDDCQYNTAAARDTGKGKASAVPTSHGKSYDLPWVINSSQRGATKPVFVSRLGTSAFYMHSKFARHDHLLREGLLMYVGGEIPAHPH